MDEGHFSLDFIHCYTVRKKSDDSTVSSVKSSCFSIYIIGFQTFSEHTPPSEAVKNS